MISRTRRSIVAAVAATAGLWLAVEAISWYRSRTGVAPGPGSGTEAIVVLGYRNTGPTANRVNRWRVRAALRSMSPTAQLSTLYFCGGSVGGSVSEARVLADYAVDGCGYRGPYRLEDHSRTTLQNIENVIPMIEGADVIKIVSNPGHTRTGRRLLQQLRPDLAARLVRAQDYRFGEIAVDKLLEIGFIPVRKWLRRNHRPRDLPHTVTIGSPAAPERNRL